MAIGSISDFYNFSIYIFDLDNTIYREEDYLFEAYKNISAAIALKIPSLNEDKLYRTLLNLYETEGRTNLFNKFLEPFDPDLHFLPLCLHVLRTFTPERKYNIFPEIKIVLKELVRKNKHIAILTNGNIEQQKNKIENIKWEKLDRSLCFVFADEFEPKPSPAGVEYILKNSGIGKNSTIMIGDSIDDRDCAVNSGIEFLDIKTLYGLTAI